MQELGENLEKKKKSNIIQTTYFNKVLSPTYDLSILVGIGRFLYFLSNPLKDIVYQISYEADPNEEWDVATFVSSILEEDSVLKLHFKHVKIVFDNRLMTFVPNDLYSEQNPVLYLENVVDIPIDHVVLIDTLPVIETQNIYAIPEKIYQLFRDQHGSNTYYHLSTTLIKACLNTTTIQLKPTNVFLNVQGNQIHILVFRQEKLLLYNAFYYQNAEDLVYYVLLVYDQLQLDNETVPLHIFGHIYKESKIYDRLYQYLKYIDFLDRTTFFRFDASFEDIPPHFFFDLYSLHTCA